jgi:hypothetical protein
LGKVGEKVPDLLGEKVPDLFLPRGKRYRIYFYRKGTGEKVRGKGTGFISTEKVPDLLTGKRYGKRYRIYLAGKRYLFGPYLFGPWAVK